MLVKRSLHNPILAPYSNHPWEAEAVFNGCPVLYNNKMYLIYRAISLPHYHDTAQMRMKVSDIGIAESLDEIHFKKRRRFIYPEYDWERFGVEDPRVTYFEKEFYIFYTAMSDYPHTASGIKVALALSSDLQKISKKYIITPFNAKGMALFPERITGKITAILTVNSDLPPSKLALSFFDSKEQLYDSNYWNNWYANVDNYSLPLLRSENDHIEVGSPPIKSKYGWLLFYSYIQNYKTNPLFTIEAVLLDYKNPLKIVGRTCGPLLTPEEYYEKIGHVQNIVFPSGAIEHDDSYDVYYGAADTVCAKISVNKKKLFSFMLESFERQPQLTRSTLNPILTPNKNNPWESKAVFNPAVFMYKNEIHMIYRAMSDDNTSTMGYAKLKDPFTILHKYNKPIYTPKEPYELKNIPNGNSGCEDPRVTVINDTLYMVYAAYNGTDPPRVALTTITINDLLSFKLKWTPSVLMSPPGYDDKDAYIFPEKIDGKYIIIHRSGEDIDCGFSSDLVFNGDIWLEEYRFITTRKGMWDSRKVGAAAPPIKTENGWVMLYHGLSEDSVYRVGAVLLDLENPLIVLGRTRQPIFEPLVEYEKVGITNNVVFPCGNILLNDILYVYYGAADQTICVASINISNLLELLKQDEI